MLFIYSVYIMLCIFRAIVFCTLVLFPATAQSLVFFFASSCFVHMFWKSSWKCNVMKTQAAYPLSVTGENVSGGYMTIVLFLTFRFVLISSPSVLLYLLPSGFYTEPTSLVYKYAIQVAKHDAIQLGRLTAESQPLKFI